MSGASSSLRIDRWLWFARFFKSRTLAASTVTNGAVKINGQRVTKPKTEIRVDDEVRFEQNQQERIVRVEAIGTRRGPAVEAQLLYTDLTPPAPTKTEDPLAQAASRDRGAGRPTKRERRAIDRLKGDL